MKLAKKLQKNVQQYHRKVAKEKAIEAKALKLAIKEGKASIRKNIPHLIEMLVRALEEASSKGFKTYFWVPENNVSIHTWHFYRETLLKKIKSLGVEVEDASHYRDYGGHEEGPPDRTEYFVAFKIKWS